MSTLPDDPPVAVPPPSGSLTDVLPETTAAQREADFNKVFSWRGKELVFSVASELYYRSLRVHMNAPPLGSYATLGDFAAEAPRVLYCASQDATTLRLLQLLPPLEQIAAFDAWVAQNIRLHELDAAARLAQEMNDVIARSRSQPADDGDTLDGSGNSPSRP